MKIGQVAMIRDMRWDKLRQGDILRVIYVPDPGADSAFVVTAYELRGKPLQAYRRRIRRKRRS